jgi:hypothetical protein
MPPPTVSAVFSDAGDVYQLLFRRSFPIALGIYAVIGGVEIGADRTNGEGARPAAGVLAFILSFAGPLLVQGALVKIVRKWFAFWVVVISYALTGVLTSVAAATSDVWIWSWATWIVLSALAVPFQAHALSVLYYRLVDPQRPAIDPQVTTWPSVWAGPSEVV